MSVTLTAGADLIELPDTLAWVDETDWDPAVQSVNHTLTGALVVERAIRQAGRPITLTGAVAERSLVDALRATLTADPPLTLHWRGADRPVHWRHGERAIEAAPLLPLVADPDAGTLCRITLRFIEV